MAEFLQSGLAVDVVLAFLAAEAALLLALRRWKGRGLGPLDILGQLGAGAALLLALRSAVTHADPRWTAGFLLAALPAHLFDLARRLRRGQREEATSSRSAPS